MTSAALQENTRRARETMRNFMNARSVTPVTFNDLPLKLRLRVWRPIAYLLHYYEADKIEKGNHIIDITKLDDPDPDMIDLHRSDLLISYVEAHDGIDDMREVVIPYAYGRAFRRRSKIFRTIDVTYKRKYGVGRAISGGLQCLHVWHRYFLLRQICINIDMKNCHPTIMMQMADEFNIDVPEIRSFIRNRAKYLRQHRLNNKRHFWGIINSRKWRKAMCKGRGMMKMLKEVEKIENYIYTNVPRIKNLYMRVNKRKPTKVQTRILALHLLEDVALSAIEKTVTSMGYEVALKLFDGLYIVRKDNDNEHKIRKVCIDAVADVGLRNMDIKVQKVQGTTEKTMLSDYNATPPERMCRQADVN